MMQMGIMHFSSGYIRGLVVLILLLGTGRTLTAAKNLDTTLLDFEQWLNALVHRMVSLSTKLDESINGQKRAAVSAKLLTGELDRQEGERTQISMSPY